MEDLARLVLLLIAVAFFANVARGSARAWLRAKFIGTSSPAKPKAAK